ncbi:hypothetical protein L247_03250 [Salmonella enterica subsp. enterica serovar Worthington str. BCH-7253]|nr:hypothetical protein L247_03250 [Salmonella enterica subsp. enterica serovar Worthington str. BCH-7253]
MQQLEALNQPLLHLDLMDGQFCRSLPLGHGQLGNCRKPLSKMFI